MRSRRDLRRSARPSEAGRRPSFRASARARMFATKPASRVRQDVSSSDPARYLRTAGSFLRRAAARGGPAPKTKSD